MFKEEIFRSKFEGCLVGAALGDALGAFYEGRLMLDESEICFLPEISGPLRYTDDTHMTLGVAESLVECADFDGDHMARRFTENYQKEPWRGYGLGPPRVFRKIKEGEAWDKASLSLYAGGSFGNGGAMRVAPIGLFFFNSYDKVIEIAHKASLITHSHILGKEGAALQALAVAIAVCENSERPLNVESFISYLLRFATQGAYQRKLKKFSSLLSEAGDKNRVAHELGNGIEAFNSVPTAIFSFLAHPLNFVQTVLYAISLGGDTDTIASMAGAISGAYMGREALPPEWKAKLENYDYIVDLAGDLWQTASIKNPLKF